MYLEETLDGSYTLYLPELDEHYHSTNGAIQESMHVYIEAGLRNINKNTISVLEIGFGTGLNAYLTLLDGLLSNKIIHYCACELYPLAQDFVNKLNYPELLDQKADAFNILHQAEWEVETRIFPNFYLQKKCTDITDLNAFSDNTKVDLIYYDAFAPSKQPEMWTQNIFDYLYKNTNEDGILVTYCAKGEVRRMLQQAGYSVKRIPGPKGKREMLQASK